MLLFALVSLALIPNLLVAVVGIVSLSYWIRLDATARGSSSPLFWAVLVPIFWPAILYYLLVFRPSNERRYPPTRWQGFAWMFAVCCFGTNALVPILSPPDPFTQVLYTPVIFVILLLLTYLLVYRRRYGRLPEVV